MRNPKIIILTIYDSYYPRMIIDGLKENGHAPEHVFIGSPVAKKWFKLRSIRSVIKHHGYLEVVKRFLDRRKENATAGIFPTLAPLSEMSATHEFKLSEYDFINSGRFMAELRSLKPDILILAGCGVVNAMTISSASIGCINGHPAVLPEARGVDVIEWSAIEGYQFGVTAHIVEEKVDAGDILSSSIVQPEKGESLAAFRNRMIVLQAEEVVKAATDLANGTHQLQRNDISQSKLYFVTNRKNRREARQKFAELTKK